MMGKKQLIFLAFHTVAKKELRISQEIGFHCYGVIVVWIAEFFFKFLEH